LKLAVAEMFRSHLEGRLPAGVDAAWYREPGEVASAAANADVLVMGFIEASEIRCAIDSANGVRWVSTHAAGVDHYPLCEIARKGMLLTKGSGAGAVAIAESVVLYVLSAAKGFPYFVHSSARHEWPLQRPSAVELDGSRALIVGYGAIGRAAGERLRAFGVDVIGVRRHPTEADLGPEEWRAQLGEFDWVVLSAALTAQTRHLIGAPELAAMKDSAWLFNIARGGLVDQDALAAALRGGKPRGAYLDVTEPEPLPSTHPLWSTPNVYITGHSSGRGTGSAPRYIELFLDNLQRFMRGEPMRNLVDLEAGY
jgi:phosphoglycerate dehydrogenase-like enzyme